MRSHWLQPPFQTLLLPLPSKRSKAKPHWTTVLPKTHPTSLPGFLGGVFLHLSSQSLNSVLMPPLTLFNCALKGHTFLQLQPSLSCLLEPVPPFLRFPQHFLHQIPFAFIMLCLHACLQHHNNLESRLISFNVVNPRLVFHFLDIVRAPDTKIEINRN